MSTALAVHGGAYSIPDEDMDQHAAGCRRALEAGWRILTAGGPALDAVEAAVRVLEDDPVFDAGTGSHLNRDGAVECDAAIMDGASLRAGAVAALQRIRNPISVARTLLHEDGSLFLVGEGALRHAIDNGFEPVPNEALVLPRERSRWERNRIARDETAGGVFGGESRTPLGTVGAVAIDREGHLAAGTSTGGTPDKHPGRVGDSPLIGCGTYADDEAGAISCTGWGESIITAVLARRAAEFLEQGVPPRRAAQMAIDVLRKKTGGLAGVIIVSPRGHSPTDRVGIAFNTTRMSRGFMVEGSAPFVAVEPE
jgi:L-asparaginase / beta-aspartyl-peptidase